MFDRSSIAFKAEEAGRKARARRAGPKALVKWPGEDLKALRIPMLGSACEDIDEQHERLETLFVDSSGFGRPGEAALTMEGFERAVEALHEEHGGLMLTIEEAGPFQVFIAVWKEKERAKDTTDDAKAGEPAGA